MKRETFFLSVVLLLTGCGSSLSIPTVEESRNTIAIIKPQFDSLNTLINQRSTSLPRGNDLISQTRLSAINTLLGRVANRSLKDLHIDFLQTRPLWKEEKSVLGIRYTNFADVDTGRFDVDLKTFRFSDFSSNLINARVEIEGTGNISVSGSHTGIRAGASPQVRLYVDENIQFVVTAADSDYIRLNPVPQTVLLKTKITITLAGLHLPYYREIPLQTTDLLRPVLIPSAIRSEIVFPIPASQYGDQRLEFVKRFLRFSGSTVRADNNVLEYRTNIDFEKE